VASPAAREPPAADGVAVAALAGRDRDSPGSPGVAGRQIADPKEPGAAPAPTVRPLPPEGPATRDSLPPSRAARSTRAAPHRQGGDGVPAQATDESTWKAAVSDGLLALDRGDFAGARSTFARAEAARPGTAAVADGLARAEEGLRAEALARHREAAEAAEAREEWGAAVAEYDAALRLDPAVAFALAGRGRAVPRAELDERLEGYLTRPDRLAAAAVAREAEAALGRAREVDRPGTRLAAQVAALDGLLAESRAPVTVRLVSDGKTEVVVLRHGPLGSFREQSVDLRPGTYAVVGRRRGYRDVRRTLVVPRGRSPEPLVVRCEEAL
jgi:hypothetical protein